MEAHFHYRVWQQEPWQMRLWRRIRFIYFLSHAENTYQGGLKSWRSLFWHAQIREERAWAESRGRNVSNNTMQRQKREKNRGAGFFFFFSLLFHNQPASARIWRYIPNPTDSVDQCHAQKSGFTRVILPKHFVKPYRCPPLETFHLSSPSFFQSAKHWPVFPEQRTCQLNRKFAATTYVGRVLKGRRE